ncbi:MAG: hypothetical protein H7321_02370, partial [Bacteroidia bacterium]|nr:hypothetical protein [Bacteroidia bacterium]
MKYRLLLFLLFSGSVAYSQKYDDTAVICKGNGVRFINNDAVGSLPSVAWEWFIPIGGNINKTQGSPSDDVVFFADTGFFEVTEVATFSNGDTAHRYVLVQVIFDKVQNIPLKDTTLCYPGKSFSYTLDAGNNGLRFRYLWSTGQKTQTITIKDSGIYSVKVFNKCDTVTKTIRIKYLDAPVVDLGVTFFVCYDNPKLLDAGNAGSKYKWSTGDSSQTILVNKSGIFSVTVTNSAGCATTSSISLKDSCPPTIFLPNVFRPDGDGI